MSASTYLANYGISVQQAHDFIFAHLDDPALIYNTAAQYGVTNEMLGEIVGGYNEDQVGAYFDSHGLASAQLDTAHPFLADDMGQLANLISLDTYGGILSVASLRQQVVSQTGATSYNAAFNPDQYEGAADGVFTSAELGVTHLGSLPASLETVESLFYGTVITALKAIDFDEGMALYNFFETYGDALDNGDEGAALQFVGLLMSVLEDSTSSPIFSDSDIAQAIVSAGVLMIQLIAHDPGAALFDGVLGGFGP